MLWAGAGASGFLRLCSSQVPDAHRAILFVTLLSLIGAFLGRSAILPIVNTGGLCLAAVFVLTCWACFAAQEPTGSVSSLPRVLVADHAGRPGVLRHAGPVLLSALLGRKPALAPGMDVLSVWGFMGVLFWFMAARIRRGISESERRLLILE